MFTFLTFYFVMFFTSFVEVSFELLYAVSLSLHDKHQLQLKDYILNFAVSRETFSFYNDRKYFAPILCYGSCILLCLA